MLMVRGLEESHVLHQAPWNINININIPYTPYNPLHPLQPPTHPLYFISHPKKNQKKFGGMKKSSYLCTRNPK